MDIVLIGASDRTILWRHGGIEEDAYDSFVEEYGALLAEMAENVIVTPDDGVYTDIALRFGEIKGKKPIAYYPDKDTYYGYDHLKANFPQYNIQPIDGDWYTLNADLTKKALTVICLGFTPGSVIELAFIKYHQKYGGFKDPSLKTIRLLIDERCTDQWLPASFSEQINNIQYYSSIKELRELLVVHKPPTDR